MASTLCPRRFVSRKLASVSAVSRDGKHERVGINGRIAIAKLAGVFDFCRDVRQLFKKIFADKASVPACAAGGNHNAIHRAQLRQRHVQAAKLCRARVAIDAAAQGILDRARLLKDFLEHVMGKPALLCRCSVEFNLAYLHVTGPAGVHHAEVIRSDRGDIVVLKINNVARVSRDGGYVTREEMFVVANTND
jgi:hypothetical protein